MAGEPARNYRWRDFEPDNTAAVRHGAHSARRWGPVADQIEAQLVADSPWLARPGFRLAVSALAVAEAKALLVDQFLDQVGLLDDDGVPRPAAALADRLHARAQALRDKCGVDPTSFARLLVSFAALTGGEDALATLRREGAAIVEARGLPQPTAEESP
jgi:hypothetical protein